MKQKLLIVLIIVAIVLSALFIFLGSENGAKMVTTFLGGSKTSCSDSDGGKDIYKKGYVKDVRCPGGTCIDLCLGLNNEKVLEYWCNSDGVDAEIINCPLGCQNGACNKPKTCVDSDGGINIYKRGYLTDIKCPGVTCIDLCAGPNNEELIERFCNPQFRSPDLKIIKCTLGCQNGACNPEKLCIDPDGGKNYYVKGSVAVIDMILKKQEGKDITDVCWDSSVLVELYCNPDGTIVKEKYTCPYGCNDGACLKGRDSSIPK